MQSHLPLEFRSSLTTALLVVAAMAASACEGDDGGVEGDDIGETAATSGATTSTGDGDGSGSGEADTMGEADTSTGGEPVCYDELSNRPAESGPPPPLDDCALPSPCPAVVHVAEGELCSVDTVYDPNAGACVVDGLRAGEPGSFTFERCPGGQYSTTYLIKSLGDGTLVWSKYEQIDLIYSQRHTWRALPDDAYFDACDTSELEGFEACIEGLGSTPCQVGEPLCPL